MKPALFLSSLILATLGAASLPSLAAPAAQPANFRGMKAGPDVKIDRIIVITDATRVVNVAGGATVQFVVGGTTFNWTFKIGNVSVVPFDLRSIAPDGVLNHAVTVYVADDLLYRNG